MPDNPFLLIPAFFVCLFLWAGFKAWSGRERASEYVEPPE